MLGRLIARLDCEFTRYLLVGGVSFLLDFGSMNLLILLLGSGRGAVYFATAVAFLLGLICNYLLSVLFVFTSARSEGKGRDLRSFFFFAAIGVAGLFLTEGIMVLGYSMLGLHHALVKLVAAALVLLFNYIMRKIFIFRV